MSCRYLRVTMPDGSKWDVPAWVIADNRAKYYKEQGENYQEEYDVALENDGVLMDWAAGDMDWSDVKSTARKVITGDEVDYQEGWVNGDKEVVEY